jgi:hypothetical protein
VNIAGAWRLKLRYRYIHDTGTRLNRDEGEKKRLNRDEGEKKCHTSAYLRVTTLYCCVTACGKAAAVKQQESIRVPI